MESGRPSSNPSFESSQLCGLGQELWFHQLSNRDNKPTSQAGLGVSIPLFMCVEIIIAQCLAYKCSKVLTIIVLGTELKTPSIIAFLIKVN